ncbi:DUF418 domain-containing protein [Wenzhouxiangella limi]|uniref:DUF418 domain-containing protein n=1 Tax=Wenzhouxiangella limi TaxID=2707351 RepID=A0A845UR56_9GAMM|nr:DUF418 domain-containing protein [Wenzhouxiangella limi]NDY94323.1 DUF418 domain-containing protein [Wenzhouxiangella limi]
MAVSPVKPVKHRLEHLDVLRGFALFGILLVNFQWFTRPLQAIVLGAEPELQGFGLAVDWLIRALAEGKFYPLFSMLFGAGFALMAERAESRRAPFWGRYLRRLLILLVFGTAHLVLIWSGDILLVYALTGFVMVALFRHTPARRLWKWALAFIALPMLLMWLAALSIWATQGDPELYTSIVADFQADARHLQESVAEAAAIHASGSWVDNVGQRLDDGRFMLANFVFWIPPILGYFLLGRWLIVTRRLLQPDQHRLFFRRWRSRGLLFGLPLAIAGAAIMHGANATVPTLSVAAGMTLTAIGALLLALAYLSLVVLGSARLRFLAPAGQMALTNYLCQSLVWTWVFYGHGLGFWNEIPRVLHPLLALAFFAAQVALSRVWLQRFHFGPAEWLWRSLTYGQRQPMRRSA